MNRGRSGSVRARGATASALRSLLKGLEGTASKEHGVSSLQFDLYSLIDRHPSADRYVIDAGRNHSKIWQLGAPQPGLSSEPLWTLTRRAELQARALLELSDTINSFLIATCASLIAGRRELAAAFIRRGLSQHGEAGYASTMRQWASLIHALRGEVELAHLGYRAVADDTNPVTRRSALAAGALHASAHGKAHEAVWFLERMRDEHPRHQQMVFARVAALRVNRCGDASERRSRTFLGQLADERYTCPPWIAAMSMDGRPEHSSPALQRSASC